MPPKADRYGTPVQRRIDALLIGSVAPPARRGFRVNMFKSLFAGLVIAAAASAAASTTINFDDLDAPSSGDQVVPNGYGGLNWTNFNVFDAFDDPGLKPSGYDVAWVSPNNVAFSAFPNDRPTETISSDTLFNLNSAFMTSVWRDSLHVEVIGFRTILGIETQIYDQPLTLSATAHTLETFNFVGVDRVEFTPSGGTFHDGYKGDFGPYFAIDNMNVDVAAVPEPSTWFAAAIALGAIGFSQRKRLRAFASPAVKGHS
jgi:hypothetical protein